MSSIGKRIDRISASFRNFKDRIRASVSVKKRNIVFFLALILVVIVAVMIRLTPVLRGPTLIKAFDPWMQYYNAKYISEHSLYEYFHWVDKKSWYPEGYQRAETRPGLPFTAVVIWWILNFIGFPVTIYEVCYYFPAFMGGLTVLAAYFLGKEVYDRNCGLLAAFFLAFNTGHMQRTMAGFFDNETIGVFATIMTLLFFLKTIKTGKFLHSIMGGLFLGYLSLSWGGYQYVFFIIPLVCVILILLNKYNENVLIAYAGIIGTGFLIYSLFFNFDYKNFFSNISLGGIFLFTIILILFHMIHSKKNTYPRFYNLLLNSIKWFSIPLIIVIAIIIWVDPNIIPLGIGPRLNSILSPLLRDKLHLVASVAEHMPSAWSIFYYNTLIPLLLLPLGIFFCFKRLNAADILLMAFLLTIFYATGSMIRVILLFAPAASLMGAYGLVNILKIYGSFIGERRISVSRKRRRQLRKPVGRSEVFAVYSLIAFLCIAQVFHATDVSINQLSYSQMVAGGQFHDWEDALTWMKNNLAGTDVVVSWWDYGYWLTPVGNVTTVNDNNTHKSKRIGMTGMAFMQTNEIYSAKILRELKADYVLVYFGFLITGMGGDEGKWPWMLRICNDHYESYKEEGLEEDNWAEGSVFLEDDYINETSGKYEEAWFQSQLVRLMFYGEPTSPSGINPNTKYLQWFYASQIGGNPSQGIKPREDDNGNEWSDHIPTNGLYDFKVFKPAYFSRNGMVKIFQVDYTALDSSFSITNPKVFDIGSSTFSLENTGTRDLTIKNIKINNKEYNFTMGRSNNDRKLSINEEDIVWIDLSVPYKKDDVVNITVTAEADALGGTKYIFEESTKNFFATEAEPGLIKINRENSKVEQNGNLANIILEVKNVGSYTTNLDYFYVNDEQNRYNATSYISGSSVLRPGEKSVAYIADVNGEFNPQEPGIKGNLVGVITSQGVKDETLLSYNTENYKLVILNEDRTLSPELLAASSKNTYKYHIPIDFNNIDTYAYTNGNIRIRVKNRGSKVLGLDSVYIAKANSVKYGNIFNLTNANDAIESDKIDTINHDLILNPNDENTIVIEPSDLPPGLSQINLNEELIIAVSAKGYMVPEPVASDIGVIQAIKAEPNITIIETIDGLTPSYIAANETGKLLIKNTGNEVVNLTNIILNDTTTISIANNVSLLYGDAILNVSKCTLLTFDIPGLKINQSNELKVNVTTNTTAQDIHRFNAIVNSNYYNILVINNGTGSANLIFRVNNNGTSSVEIDSIYINGTNIDLGDFTRNPPTSLVISSGGTIQFSIAITTLETNYFGGAELNDKKLRILGRTKEGAENTKDIAIP
ncbi:MAG: STT3 domain-containing protein [Candidatus Hodarchaeota archaeon]